MATQARDVMTTGLASVGPDTPVAEIAQLLLARGIGAVPVLGPGGVPLGVVSESDLVARPELETEAHPAWWLQLLRDPQRQAAAFVRSHGRVAAEVMTPGVVCIHPDSPLGDVAALMAERRIRRVYVGEGGALIGVITRADLLRTLAGRIEAPPPAMRDADLLQEIRRRFADEPWAREAWVTFSVRDGRVELAGAVESDVQRRALELLVRGVPGVVDVVDRLRRRQAGGTTIY
jgi:CBS domain-containing protein